MSSQSSLVVHWQRIYNSLTGVFKSHAKSSFHTCTHAISVSISSQLSSTSILRNSLKLLLSWPGIFVIELRSGSNRTRRFYCYSSTISRLLLAYFCRVDLFTESLPSNERLFRFSGVMSQYHSIPYSQRH
jgi:hypothetical protein